MPTRHLGLCVNTAMAKSSQGLFFVADSNSSPSHSFPRLTGLGTQQEEIHNVPGGECVFHHPKDILANIDGHMLMGPKRKNGG